MSCYSKRCVNFVTLIISIIIFIQINWITYMIFNISNNNKIEKQNTQISTEAKKYEEKEEWKITIPKINVTAQIKEGTKEEIINDYAGHFEATPKFDGNVGIIAGSSGYKENYFKDLEKLETRRCNYLL